MTDREPNEQRSQEIWEIVYGAFEALKSDQKEASELALQKITKGEISNALVQSIHLADQVIGGVSGTEMPAIFRVIEYLKIQQLSDQPVDMNKYIEQYSLWHSTDVQVWQAFTKMGNMRLLLEVGNEPFNQSLNSLNREDSVRTMETAIIYRDILKYRRTLEKDQGETELNLQLQLVDHLRTKVKFSGDSSSLS